MTRFWGSKLEEVTARDVAKVAHGGVGGASVGGVSVNGSSSNLTKINPNVNGESVGSSSSGGPGTPPFLFSFFFPQNFPATFKWVRGELIGRGTYGKVYLALNATTGEMMAVKQVEMPRTASDLSDQRQTTVVQALKSESDTLKDLDHMNIVQYLGFEETPKHLSM
jgi:mitogen-activated protein kinase kinase kinase